MTPQPDMWNIIKKHLPQNDWMSLEEIYELIERNCDLDDEDFMPQSPKSDLPKWKRNVRNILQYRKNKGDVLWNGNAQYRGIRAKQEILLNKLSLIETIQDIRSNVRRFNRDANAFLERALNLIRQTSFWVYDPDNDIFGPSKFVGYRSMTFKDYESAINGELIGADFNGHVTRTGIEKVIGQNYFEDQSLEESLLKWGVSLFGQDVFEGIKRSKWVFNSLPQGRNYWTFCSNPKIYNVESAMNVLEVDNWSIGNSKVRKGDRVVLWRGLKGGKRGVIGLAEVISDPKMMLPQPSSLQFYVGDAPKELQSRVWVRYQAMRDPLWLDEDETGTLDSLSVSKAHGGTVFHVEPEQWHRVVSLHGGWEEDESAEEVENIALIAEHRSRGGQGFKISQKHRKAIESYAMRKAEYFFHHLGYDVQDVSSTHSYDLFCIKGNEEFYVEVKGTKTEGKNVILTRNEVNFARKNKNNMALFVHHSVKVKEKKQQIIVSGGKSNIFLPWIIDNGGLMPLEFRYDLPESQ